MLRRPTYVTCRAHVPSSSAVTAIHMFFPFFCIIIVIIIVMFIHHYYYYLQIHYLRALGGGSLGAAVRMMMRKVATNDVWAGFFPERP